MISEEADEDDDDDNTVQFLTRRIISTCSKGVQSHVENDENLKITKRTLFFTSWYVVFELEAQEFQSYHSHALLHQKNLNTTTTHSYQCNFTQQQLTRIAVSNSLLIYKRTTRIELRARTQVRVLGTFDRQQKEHCDCVSTLRYKMATCESCLVYGISFGT